MGRAFFVNGRGGQSDRSMIHGVQTVGAVTRTRLTEWILLGLSLGLSSGAFRVSRTSRRSLNRHHSEHRNSAVPGQVKLEIVLGVKTLAGSNPASSATDQDQCWSM